MAVLRPKKNSPYRFVGCTVAADEGFELKTPKFEIVPLTHVLEKLENAAPAARGNSDEKEKPEENPKNVSDEAVGHRKTLRRPRSRM